MRRSLAALACGLLAACNAPDYTPVRDWARTASLVADHPAATVPPAAQRDGILAMQEALATYLAALARMADDGVLPYPEDPFVQQAVRAAAADRDGAEAVAGLGAFLRRATRGNWQAPDLRDSIRTADPLVQALVAALGRAVRGGQPAGEAGDAVAAYTAALAAIGEGHAMLKARARDITSEEVARLARAEEDRLRRAARALPVPRAAPPTAAAP